MRLVLKSILFALLLPGIVAGVVPFLFFAPSGANAFKLSFSSVTILALLMGLPGLGLLIYCIWEFAAIGKGTLAPIDAPKTLVVRGAYRYTRNPMYLAVCIILISETMLFKNSSLLIYTMTVALCFHCFVYFYEEPRLRKRFGNAYLNYCRAVPRWRFAFKPLKS